MNRKPILCTALILLIVPFLGLAETSAIRVDGKIIKDYITRMSGNTQMGRRSLTPGYENVAEWAAGLFKQWGLKPAGENGTYFQSVPITGERSSLAYSLGTPSLILNGRTFYIRDNDFAIDPSSTPTPKSPLNGIVVFAGYGISAPSKGLDEYAGMDVKGKVVLALKGSPKDAPVARGMGMGMPPSPGQAPQKAEPDEWKDESADMAKAKTAYEKGAVAILLYNPAGAQPIMTPFGPAGPVRRELEPSPFTRPFIFVSNIEERVFRWILWTDPMQSANEFNARIDQIRRDIKAKKARSMPTAVKALVKGYDSVTLYGEKFKNNSSRNVLAKIEGTDAALKSEYVIVGGHLDHLGVTNGVVFNGADDNASGSAVAMEVGRLLAQNKVPLKRTFIVGLWCGEEQGLIGSRYYVTHPTDGVTMDKTLTYFNMDMVGLGDAIGAPGALNFPDIFNVIMRDQLPEVADAVKPSTGGPGGSDHSGFIELGIESLALMTQGGGGHPDYHQSGDDTEKIDAGILGKTGQFVLQGVINLANETTAKLLIPDRQAQYDGMRITIPTIGTGGPAPGGARGGAGLAWSQVNASTPAELLAAAGAHVRQLRSASANQARAMAAFAMGGRGAGTGIQVTFGVRDAGLFDGNIPLMQQLAGILDFGRVDVTKNDGAWFNYNTGVSDKGREAVKAMEAGNVVVNLVNPSSKLLSDMLDAAAKPFLVTLSGAAPVETSLIARMNQKNSLLALHCSPGDVNGCVQRIEDARRQFGDKDNLLLFFTSNEKADEARKSLYLSLIGKGWTKDEIYAMVGVSAAGSPAGARGNLSKVIPAPPRPPAAP